MRDLVAEYFAKHDLELWALGCVAHRGLVDDQPFGQTARYVEAEYQPALVRSYLSANRQAFSGPLALPG